MTDQAATCPYCNSHLPPGLKPVAGRGLVCPRCQEVLPQSSDLAASAALSSQAGEYVPSRGERPGSKQVAAYVLCLMFGMAGLGLAFAWYTTSTRRARDRVGDQFDPDRNRISKLAPDALPAFGYLPSDVNAIVGLQVADGDALEDSRRFLHAIRSLPVGPGGAQVDSFATLRWDQIDHAVLGICLEDRLLPRFTLVVRARSDFDQAAFLKGIGAQKKDHGKRTLYAIQGTGLEVTLWLPDARTVVICRAAEDFDPVPFTPAPGINRFNADLQQTIKDSVPSGALVWLAAATRRGDQMLSPLVQFGIMAQTDLDALGAIQKLAAWFRVDTNLEAGADADLRDEKAATQFKAYLAQLGIRPGQASPWLQTREQTQRLATQLEKSLKIEQKDSRLSMRASCSMDAFLEALKR